MIDNGLTQEQIKKRLLVYFSSEQPDQNLQKKKLSLDELLTLNEEKFVDQAYQFCLHRLPDLAGLQHNLALLNQGVSKQAIILALSYGPEGQKIKREPEIWFLTRTGRYFSFLKKLLKIFKTKKS